MILHFSESLKNLNTERSWKKQSVLSPVSVDFSDVLLFQALLDWKSPLVVTLNIEQLDLKFKARDKKLSYKWKTHWRNLHFQTRLITVSHPLCQPSVVSLEAEGDERWVIFLPNVVSYFGRMRCINAFAWLGLPVNDGDGEHVQRRDALLSFSSHYHDFPLEAVTEILSKSVRKNKTKKTQYFFLSQDIWSLMHLSLKTVQPVDVLASFWAVPEGCFWLSARCASVHLAKYIPL